MAKATPASSGALASPATNLNGRRRTPTATSRFGVSRRENHDSSDFYERFPAPEISEDAQVNRPAALDRVWVGDARAMDRWGEVADASVALVVTSPPYYAGKEYEAAVGEGHVPASYLAYLDMLADVFAECRRKLEPGGRIAVNVANLGRKPYRSLAADVIGVLQDLRFLIRGEVVWIKGRAAGGSCAWGSFQRPGNPVLRDVTERIVVASKGRFDRAVPARRRAEADLPSVATVSADEFMDLTTDVWEFPPERATRVGHPAPFPVELPRRFIDLYTYEGDLVLDPFMGSGSTAVAAVRRGRHFVGFDTDPAYVEAARRRVDEERRGLADEQADPRAVLVRVPAPPAAGRGEPSGADAGPVPGVDDGAAVSGDAGASAGPVAGVDDGAAVSGDAGASADPVPGVDDGAAESGDAAASADPVARRREMRCAGRKASDVARTVLEQAGFAAVETRNIQVRGVPVTLRAQSPAGRRWYVDVVGGFSNEQPGLRRNETLWRALGKAATLAAAVPDLRFALFTTELPAPGSMGAVALAAARGSSLTDVVDLLDDDDVARFQRRWRAEPTERTEGTAPA